MWGKWLCLALAGVVLPSRGAEPPRTEYFPAELHTPSVACNIGSFHLVPLLSSFEDRWFSQHLAAAKEPSLFGQSLKTQSGESYRFTWLRSFHAPVVVHIDILPGGGMLMTAKILSGRGGYAPGHVAKEVRRTLASAEIAQVKRAFGAPGFVYFRTNPCDFGFDGAEWIVETRSGHKYRVLKQWSPTRGAIRDIGTTLLTLTGLSVGPIY